MKTYQFASRNQEDKPLLQMLLVTNCSLKSQGKQDPQRY